MSTKMISVLITVISLVAVTSQQEPTKSSTCHPLMRNETARSGSENESSESEMEHIIDDEINEDLETELKVAFVIFRHGQFSPGRAVLEYYLYPSTFDHMLEYPILTYMGKRDGIRLGQELRQRYNNMLSELYHPSETICRSIDSYLSKAGLFFVLDGLYPLPSNSIVQFHKDINWQPVPFNVVPVKADDLAFNENCPTYMRMKNETLNLPAVQQLLEPFKEILQLLDNITTHRITTLDDLTTLNYVLESSGASDIPAWVPTIQKEIERLTHIDFLIQLYNASMIRFASGVILKEIMDTMQIIRKAGKTRKLYLISGSEYNVAAIMAGCLLVTTPHQPKLGSAFFLEVHYVTSLKDYAVKVFYKKDMDANATLVPIKGCEKKRYCWVKNFIKLIKPFTISYNDFQMTCKIGEHTEYPSMGGPAYSNSNYLQMVRHGLAHVRFAEEERELLHYGETKFSTTVPKCDYHHWN